MLSVLTIMGALYSSVIFGGVPNLMMVMSVVFEERVVYYREKAAGMYSPLAFAVAQVRSLRSQFMLCSLHDLRAACAPFSLGMADHHSGPRECETYTRNLRTTRNVVSRRAWWSNHSSLHRQSSTQSSPTG